jgi:hypothetical protein
MVCFSLRKLKTKRTKSDHVEYLLRGFLALLTATVTNGHAFRPETDLKGKLKNIITVFLREAKPEKQAEKIFKSTLFRLEK